MVKVTAPKHVLRGFDRAVAYYFVGDTRGPYAIATPGFVEPRGCPLAAWFEQAAARCAGMGLAEAPPPTFAPFAP